MKKVLLIGVAGAIAVLTAVGASAARAETCVTWGPTVAGVPEGICLPV